MEPFTPEQLTKLVGVLYTGMIASFGGMVNYFYGVSQGKEFRVTMLMINLTIAFFVGGFVAGEFIPAEMPSRDGLIAIAGVASYQILEMIYTKAPGIFGNFIKK